MPTHQKVYKPRSYEKRRTTGFVIIHGGSGNSRPTSCNVLEQIREEGSITDDTSKTSKNEEKNNMKKTNTDDHDDDMTVTLRKVIYVLKIKKKINNKNFI